MERGIEALVEYPHGCVEQTTSRLIPMVLLEELLGGLSMPGLGDEHRSRMNDAIAHVLRHQNDDGGFGCGRARPRRASRPPTRSGAS